MEQRGPMSAGYLAGYARTRTEEQQAGLEAQVAALEAAGCKKVFQEQVSSIGQRKELETALTFVREGDTFVVTKLDRLARSTQHALSIVEDLERRGVGLRILDFGGEPIATKSPHGKLVLTMFAAFAEFERRLMLERQRAGIARAKSEGKYKGRKPTARAKADQVKALAGQGIGPSEIARKLGIGRSSSIVFCNEQRAPGSGSVRSAVFPLNTGTLRQRGGRVTPIGLRH